MTLPDGTRRYIIQAMAKPDPAAPNASEPVANPPAEPGIQEKPGASKRPREIGGPGGLEPTRYGDWERNGRVSDF
jgi:hypothetical protein